MLKKIAAKTIIAGGIVFSPFIMANDVNLAATTVPASACQPADADQDEKLKLSNGAYVFRAGVTGTASLLCPLPVNGWQAGVLLFDQDFYDPSMSMSKFRVYYADPNTCSSSVDVSVVLRYRKKTAGVVALNPSWSSTQTGGGICFPGIAGSTTATVPKVHTLKEGRLYHFLVKLKRTVDTQNPVFSGIDFPLNFVHEG